MKRDNFLDSSNNQRTSAMKGYGRSRETCEVVKVLGQGQTIQGLLRQAGNGKALQGFKGESWPQQLDL